MANTTLAKDDGSLSVTLSNSTDKIIRDNECPKTAELTPYPMYTLDSDQTDVGDFGGSTKTITLTGAYFAVSTSAAQTFIGQIEDVINGQQDTNQGWPLKLTDDIRGTIYVKVEEVNTRVVAGDTGYVEWTLKLIQSSKNI